MEHSTAFYAQRMISDHEARMAIMEEQYQRYRAMEFAAIMQTRDWTDYLDYVQSIRDARWYNTWYYELARRFQLMFPDWIAL